MDIATEVGWNKHAMAPQYKKQSVLFFFNDKTQNF